LKAGCPAEVCGYCGKPREKIVKRIRPKTYNPSSEDKRNIGRGYMSHHRPLREIFRDVGITQTIGWADCSCSQEDKYVPGVVLDPFAGSGTTGLVAEKIGLNSIQIDIKRDYCIMCFERLSELTAQAKLSGERSKIEKMGF
ncbi:hypothetical protein COT50_03800, partial [candidate division WWE3 bacterium CG08_land_8_20_14_0_20_41_10]